MKPTKPIILDGRTGEGGGQLVRVATALAAVTRQPIRIHHVRGNRAGPRRGGGLKAQHVSSIRWLAEATRAEVKGLEVGSQELEFRPVSGPAEWRERSVVIGADSPAASALLVLQAVLPFLVFAADGGGGGEEDEETEPIELVIEGGTNVSWSLSYEYADQVLFPALEENFGIRIERRLEKRGWSTGPLVKGRMWLRIHPIARGQALRLRGRAWDQEATEQDFEMERIDASIVVPGALHGDLQRALVRDLDALFPSVDVVFKTVEDSGHDARIYVLLVARSRTGLRWGRDLLGSSSSRSKKKQQQQQHQQRADELAGELSRRVARDLYKEISLRGVVDEFLQDQLVVFQALADGRSGFHHGSSGMAEMAALREGAVDPDDDEANYLDPEAHLQATMRDLQLAQEVKRDRKTAEPFGEGSLHTTTARWVTTELLPQVKWYNRGNICEGIGKSFSCSTDGIPNAAGAD